MTTDTPTQAYEFDRYINGILMAEGVTIERQKSLEDAMRAAALIAPRGPNGEAPVLVHRLASQPEAGDPVVWEPIETAPKDGSYVDLWCAPLTEAGVALLPCRITNCYWVEDYAAWYTSSLRGEPIRVWHRVTHWMTPPNAPGTETPLYTNPTPAELPGDALRDAAYEAGYSAAMQEVIESGRYGAEGPQHDKLIAKACNWQSKEK